MKINAMPTSTWNRLHVNEADASVISWQPGTEYKAEFPEGILYEKLSAEEAGDLTITEGPETGMGPAFDEIYRGEGRGCLVLRTQEGTKNTEAVRLTGNYPDGGQGLGRIAAEVAAGSELTLVLEAAAETGAAGTAGVQLRARLGKNAKLTVYETEMLGPEYTGMFDLGVECAEGARAEIVQLFLGTGKIYTGCRTLLAGNGSSVDISLGYRTARDSRLDMNYVAVHEGRRTDSRLFTSGVLRENAMKVFRGTIDFRTGAKEAVGDEREEVLLMDDEVINRTVPVILCSEEDVEGSHGATIGRIDEDMLFYLQSRGIAERDVYEMLADAKVDAVRVRIKDAQARERAGQYLEGGNGNDEG